MIRLAQRLEHHLSDRYAFDLRAVLFVQALFVLFSSITLAKDWTENPIRSLTYILIALLLEVVFLFAIGFLRVLTRARSSILKIWFTYWLAGEVSAICLIFLFQIPFTPPGAGVSAITLLATNGLLKIAWFSICHLAVSLLDSQFAALTKLQSKATQLAALQSEGEAVLASELSALRSAIRDKIKKSLQSISMQLSELSASSPREDLSRRAEFVAQICDGEVRSLSHEIAEGVFPQRLLFESPKRILNPWTLTRGHKTEVSLRWHWVAAIGAPNAVTLALQQGGWLSAMAAIGAIVLGIFLIEIVDRARLKWWRSNGALATATLIVAEYVGLSGFIFMLLRLVGGKISEIKQFTESAYIVTPIVIVVVWLLVQAIHDFAARLDLYTADMIINNRAIELEIAKSKLRSERARGRLSRLLHGTTQGRLASISLALTVASKSKSTSEIDGLLDQAKEQLSAAESEINLSLSSEDPTTFTGIENELGELVKGWRNLISIRYQIGHDVGPFLANHPELATSVLESMRELVTNAVRHGRAESIDLDLWLGEKLCLQAVNDGDPIVELIPGFGVSSISQTASNVTFHRHGDFTAVQVSWPTTE